MNILAIDQGTSSTKALVISEEGTILAKAEVAVHPHPVGRGGMEQDPSELLASIIEAGRAALASTAVSVGAVGIANQGETVVAWNERTGLPASAAISWQDRRASVVTDQLSSAGDRLLQITGLPLDPYFTAPKLRWLTDRVTGPVRVTGIDAWINHRLIGRTITDVSTASRSLLLDLDTREWSYEASSHFELDIESLPEIVDCAGYFGETEAFGPALPVTGLSVDQQAALIGENCLDAGEGKCTYGTGAFLLVTTGREPKRSKNGLSASVAWQIGDDISYCLDGQVYTAGSAVVWLEKLGMIKNAADLDLVASKAAASSQVVCVPSLAGLGAPYWQPQAACHIEGLTLDSGPSEIVFSVLEGLACQATVLVRAAESDIGKGLVSLRVDGGLTRSSVLMQLQANILQTSIDVFPSPHATALGIASLARLGAGASFSDSRGVAIKGHRYEPCIGPDEAAERLARWEEAAQRTLSASSSKSHRS